jgi:putative ABC transport system permease protein
MQIYFYLEIPFGWIFQVFAKRTKEIGIRKINGASVFEVMVMLSNNFVKLLAISFVITTPIAWYVMQRWLQNFAYKTELSWWIFVLAGINAFIR